MESGNRHFNTIDNVGKLDLAVSLLNNLFPGFATSTIKFEVLESLKKFDKKLDVAAALTDFCLRGNVMFPNLFKMSYGRQEFVKYMPGLAEFISKVEKFLPTTHVILMEWDEEKTYFKSEKDEEGRNISKGYLYYPQLTDRDTIGRVVKNDNSVAAGPRSHLSDIKWRVVPKAEFEKIKDNYEPLSFYPGEIYLENKWFEKRFLYFLCVKNGGSVNLEDLKSISTSQNLELIIDFINNFKSEEQVEKYSTLNYTKLFEHYINLIKTSLSKEYFNGI